MDPIDVVAVRPTSYIHVRALNELAETVVHGLNAIGIPALLASWIYGPYPARAGRRDILIGAHLLTPEQMGDVEDGVIVYNTEQYGPWFTPDYRALLKRHEVWDVTPDTFYKHVPVGYRPELRRIVSAEVQDIDVLFYGSGSPRREAILQQLRDRGHNVVHLFGVYGAERDAYIARSKVVLSMHYAEGGQFEQVRVSYLLANSKAVVAEGRRGAVFGSPETELAVPYEALVRGCEIALASATHQRIYEKAGFLVFSQMREEDILREALGLPA